MWPKFTNPDIKKSKFLAYHDNAKGLVSLDSHSLWHNLLEQSRACPLGFVWTSKILLSFQPEVKYLLWLSIALRSSVSSLGTGMWPSPLANKTQGKICWRASRKSFSFFSFLCLSGDFPFSFWCCHVCMWHLYPSWFHPANEARLAKWKHQENLNSWGPCWTVESTHPEPCPHICSSCLRLWCSSLVFKPFSYLQSKTS